METSRAARRESMREAGIPTSQQPKSQDITDAGRVYNYEAPTGDNSKQLNNAEKQFLLDSGWILPK